MKAKFEPFNRHLVVDIVEDKQENQDSLVVLPTDYEKPLSPYARAVVVETSTDSKFNNNLSVGDTVLVERRMLHKVDINEYSFYLVLENYIYGRINNEID